MYYLFQVLFIPFKLLKLFYYFLFQFLHKGDSIFVNIPNKFTQAEKSFFASLVSGKEEGIILFEFLNQLELISKSKAKNVFFFLEGDFDLGWAEIYQITEGINQIKSKGIKTHGFCSGGGLASIYILSFLEKRYTSKNGEFMVVLPSSEPFFYGGLLQKLQIEVEGHAVGAYKSFAETFTRTSFSKEAKENLSSMIRSIRTTILEDIYENSKLDSDDLKKVFLNSDKLVKQGFFSTEIDEENYINHFEYENFEDSKKKIYSKLDFDSVLFHSKKNRFKIFKKKPKSIYILPLSGTIEEGKSEQEDIKADKIESYPLLKLLRELKEDSTVEAVILEIDSGGGSARASEKIYQEILKLKEKKKVYAYFQNVSASGGYYISSACDKIYATPFTITGSIGTVMIRANLKKFYNQFGITKDRIEFYPHRDLLSEYGKISPESLKLLQEELNRVNKMFYERVISSRKKTLKEMDKLGGGRIFTGKNFLASNMLDKNISLIETVKEIKEELNLEEVNIEYKTHEYNLKNLIKENFKFLNELKNLYKTFKNFYSNKNFELKNDLVDEIKKSLRA